jgi:hypothetical protein
MKPRTTIVGTAYFPSVGDAQNYFKLYNETPESVLYKIETGSIKIGDPPTYNHEIKRELVLDKDTRSYRWVVTCQYPLFKVTGVDLFNKRFRMFTENWLHALNVNLWRGTVWKLDTQNKWRIVKRVWN